MVVFLESFVVFRYLDARLCDFNPSELTPKTCRLTNLITLDSDCVYLIGDLRIDSGDEEHVEKLKTVSVLIGSLRIKNTAVADLSFLGNLRKVANLNGLWTIYVG